MQTELISRLKFNADGHIPSIIQDAGTKRVLTLCYLNRDALAKTLAEGVIYVYRRSLGKLMKKGETSGHIQEVQSVSLDCEGKSLLFEVRQKVAACHKGYFSCYFESVKDGHLETKEKPVFDPKKVY